MKLTRDIYTSNSLWHRKKKGETENLTLLVFYLVEACGLVKDGEDRYFPFDGTPAILLSELWHSNTYLMF